MVIREDPLIADNYFGRSTLVSLRVHHTTNHCAESAGVQATLLPAHYNHDMEAHAYVHTDEFVSLLK